MQITRTRLIEFWLIGVALAALTAFLFGRTPGGTTAALLVALAIVPAVLIRMLWPGEREVTADDILHDRA